MLHWKLTVDILMGLIMIPVMAERATKLPIHEYLGTVLILLFILHHVLNFNWFRRLGKGRYPRSRKLEIGSNILLTLAFIMIIISSIMTAKYVFTLGLPIETRHIWKRIHFASAYWFIAFLGIHIGLHWQMVLAKFRNFPLFANKILARGSALLLTLAGAYTFIATSMAPAMIQIRRRAVFPHPTERNDFIVVVAFFCILAMWTVLGHYGRKLLLQRR